MHNVAHGQLPAAQNTRVHGAAHPFSVRPSTGLFRSGELAEPDGGLGWHHGGHALGLVRQMAAVALSRDLRGDERISALRGTTSSRRSLTSPLRRGCHGSDMVPRRLEIGGGGLQEQR